jgi:hypothetical protein
MEKISKGKKNDEISQQWGKGREERKGIFSRHWSSLSLVEERKNEMLKVVFRSRGHFPVRDILPRVGRTHCVASEGAGSMALREKSDKRVRSRSGDEHVPDKLRRPPFFHQLPFPTHTYVVFGAIFHVRLLRVFHTLRNPVSEEHERRCLAGGSAVWYGW